MGKISKTYVRTEKTMNDYIKFSEMVEEGKVLNDFDTNLLDKSIKDFKYWFIVENRFPYDAFAEVSHMILPKRKVPFDWNLLSKEELDEFWEIKQKYIAENYEVIYENLPQSQTVPKWFHLHLLRLKRN